MEAPELLAEELDAVVAKALEAARHRLRKSWAICLEGNRDRYRIPDSDRFRFYILAVMLRFLLQCVRADFYNPLVQFLVRITNPLLLPLRRFVPGYRGLDLASVVLAFALQLPRSPVGYRAVRAIPRYRRSCAAGDGNGAAQVVDQHLSVGVIIQAVLSWINPDPRHPAARGTGATDRAAVTSGSPAAPPVSGWICRRKQWWWR